MPQRYICANLDGKHRTIAELKGHKVNMICNENCLHPLRVLVWGIPARVDFAPENCIQNQFDDFVSQCITKRFVCVLRTVGGLDYRLMVCVLLYAYECIGKPTYKLFINHKH